MGRKKETPVTQKLKALTGSPELVQDANSPKSVAKPKAVTRNSSRVSKIQSNLPVISQNKTTKASSTIATSNTDTSNEATSELSPKMFYSKKRLTRSSKSIDTDDCASSNIPSCVTRAKKTVPMNENQEVPNEIDNDAAGISPKLFYSRSRKHSQVQPVPKVVHKKMKLTEKPVRTRCTSTKQQSSELATEQILSELTDSPKVKKLLPVAEVLESIVKDDCSTNSNVTLRQTRVSRIKNNSSKVSDNIAPTKKVPEVTVKRPLRISANTPAQTSTKVGVSRRKNCSSGLTIAEIVAEVSTEGASGLLKSTGSNTKTDSSSSSVNSEKGTQKMSTQSSNCTSKNSKRKTTTKKSLSKKASGSADSEWDQSLLLVTDDFNSSKNVYDFEEFQVGSSQALSGESSSRRNTNSEIQSSTEKKLSAKKIAAIKAVFNDKKRKMPTGSIKKAKVKKTTKTVQPRRNTLVKRTAASKAVPVTGSSNQGEKIKVPELHKMSITPVDQLLTGAASFREIEKEKAKKHLENKIVSKINPGLNQQGSVAETAVLGPSSIWPGLAMAAPKKYTQLKRLPMEGPLAADILKVKQLLLPKCLPPTVRKTSSKSSMSSSSKKQIVECDYLGLKLKDPSPIGDTNNHIDLFTYPIPPVYKKKKLKTDQNKKLKENKTPSKGFLDFLYAGSVERYLKPEKTETSPAAVMLPKFLTTDTSTPNTLATGNKPPAKDFGTNSFCISPVKEFQSPATMRTYAHISRRSSLQFLFTSHIAAGEHLIDDDNNVLQKKKNCQKSKRKNKETLEKNGDVEKWAERMSSEFDEIENFQLSIEE